MDFKRTRFVALVGTVLIGTALMLSGCDRQGQVPLITSGTAEASSTQDPLVTWQSLSDPQQSGATLFRRLTAIETGVDFVVPIDLNHPLKRLYAAGLLCGGVAIGDFDGDQSPDLYLVNGPKENRLYLQTGTLEFEDHTRNTGGGDAWGVSASVVDIDNDGDEDIYVCNYDSPNALYINQGDATFVEAAKQYGLDVVDASFLMTFCDYDRDGDLDGYLLTNRYYRDGGLPSDLKLIRTKAKSPCPKSIRSISH